MDVWAALKIWNEAKGGEYLVPKKGTPEFEEVKAIMKGGKAKKASDEKKKIVAKIDLEKEKKKAVVKRFLLRAVGKAMIKRQKKKLEAKKAEDRREAIELQARKFLGKVLREESHTLKELKEARKRYKDMPDEVKESMNLYDIDKEYPPLFTGKFLKEIEELHEYKLPADEDIREGKYYVYNPYIHTLERVESQSS